MKPPDFLPKFGHMRTPPKSKVKIGSRKLYLDADPSVYYFIAKVVKDINNGKGVNVKTEWKKELRINKNLCIGKRAVFSVFSKKPWQNDSSQIDYSVNWNLLLRSLEIKSRGIVENLKRNPNIGLGILYDELASKYVKFKSLANSYVSVKDNAKQILGIRQTSDWKELEQAITRVSELFYEIETRFPTDSFFELQGRLYRYARDLDFNGLYYTLRETLDRIFPILFILAILKKQNIGNRSSSTLLYLLYLNYTLREYWKNSGQKPKRINIDNKNFDNVSKEFSDSVANYNLFNTNGSLNFDQWNKAIENNDFRLPLVDIDSKGFSVLSTILGINLKTKGGLKRVYEVCSSSVHNLLSFPFIFFLEVKVAKHFIGWYEEELENVLRQLNIITTTQTEKGVHVTQEYNISLGKLVDFYRSHQIEISSIIAEQASKKEWDFETLKSFYRVFQPGVSRLRKASINYHDFREALLEVERVSYTNGIWLAENNLKSVGNAIIEQLKKAHGSKVPSVFLPAEVGFVCTYMYFEYTETSNVDNNENRKAS